MIARILVIALLCGCSAEPAAQKKTVPVDDCKIRIIKPDGSKLCKK